jgi:hypothetical protein
MTRHAKPADSSLKSHAHREQNAQTSDQEVTVPIKLLRNAEIDSQPMLDQDHKLMCKAMRTRARKDGTPFTMMDFARVRLRTAAIDYTSDESYERVVVDAELQRAALTFVYEALKACGHDIITQWPEFDTMLQQLEDLGTLGFPT